MGAYQIVTQVLFNYLVKGNRTSQRDDFSSELIVSQRSQSPQRKNYLIQLCELCVVCVVVLECHF